MRTARWSWIALIIAAGCGGKPSHREQCVKIADHLADVVIDHYVGHPDELWDVVRAEPGDPGIPPRYTKATFKDFLATPEGQTWIMKRRGGAREGTHAAIEQCVERVTSAQVKCLLAAKTRDDVKVCDGVK